MNSIVSSIASGVYKHAVKPILFTQKPDAVHSRLLRYGSRMQNIAPVRKLVQANWAYENQTMLSQTFHGIHFSNPVGLSAGFDKNFELMPMLKSIGFGFVEGGSLTFLECAGNPRPWFFRLPNSQSIVVYAGLANQGVGRITRRIQDYPAGTFDNLPLNISVAKTNAATAMTDAQAVADYIGSLQVIKQVNVGQMITLNISCPNTYGGEPFTTPGRLELLLAAVDEVQLSQPVFIKMPCHLGWERFRALVNVAVEHKVAGLTISNLAKDRRTADLADPLPNSVKGGMSGKPTWDLSNELLKRTRMTYEDRFTLIGVGGIFSAEDAYTKIKFGANLVELITGLIFEGPQLIGQINSGLVRLLERDGFNNIAQATGTGLR